MPLVIDCYNLLHANMPAELAGLDERGLCAALEQSGMVRRDVTVVCDGAPKPHSPAADETGDVTFIFSGPRRSADSIIIELIDRNSAPRRLQVVSDDREIIAAARRRRAQAVSTAAFIGKLAAGVKALGKRTKGQRGPEKPTQPLTDQQVDGWLRQFGYESDTPRKKPWWKELEE